MIRQICSGLKYPPLKYISKNLPENFIWQSKDKYNIHYFSMFKTSDQKIYSKMACIETKQIINSEEVPSLYIVRLESFPKKQGLGTKMLDFAQKFSKSIGCEGRFLLCASKLSAEDSAPHLFYRKYGLDTKNAEINAKMDEFIKLGKKPVSNDFDKVIMFYPPICEKHTKLSTKVKKSISFSINMLLKFVSNNKKY